LAVCRWQFSHFCKQYHFDLVWWLSIVLLVKITQKLPIFFPRLEPMSRPASSNSNRKGLKVGAKDRKEIREKCKNVKKIFSRFTFLGEAAVVADIRLNKM
jgi:hypothetical protein